MKKLTRLDAGRYSFEYEKGKLFYIWFTRKIIYNFVSGKHRPQQFWSYEVGSITQNGFRTRQDAIEEALKLIYLQSKARA